MRPINDVNTIAASPEPLMAQSRSPWHSPVPYLFGGLAAMLALIAFSLLLLACSYCRLSARFDNNNGGGAGESGENEGVCEEKILVIMAGEVNPTFLATPVFTKPSNFGELKDKQGAEKCEKVKEEMGDDHQQQNQTT
ncbi:hypothetical protein HRI_005251200 [Hibiscus trionum]|uniref:Uncharacterized protein n=1 Tax=Hibiscus trionum TaxID=183268 RepID=A0A9W7MWZ2_HIBTR|nr:hypothetical protein HRI_005251200 [Hibiscus trionum]